MLPLGLLEFNPYLRASRSSSIYACGGNFFFSGACKGVGDEQDATVLDIQDCLIFVRGLAYRPIVFSFINEVPSLRTSICTSLCPMRKVDQGDKGMDEAEHSDEHQASLNSKLNVQNKLSPKPCVC